MIKVEVIAYTRFIGVPRALRSDEMRVDQDMGTDAARLTECAGRECYDSYGKGRSSREYHNHIKEVGNGSVCEHAFLTFHISGISRAIGEELLRHDVGTAISKRSTRYVDESSSTIEWSPIAHWVIMNDVELHADVTVWYGLARKIYKKIFELANIQLETRGVDPRNARKQARGAARGALPLALYTSCVWTCNIRAFRNIIEQRCSTEADGHMRAMANKLYEAALPWWEEYLNDYTRVPAADGVGYALQTIFRKI